MNGTESARPALFDRFPDLEGKIEWVRLETSPSPVQRLEHLTLDEPFHHRLSQPKGTEQRRVGRYDDVAHGQARRDTASVLATGAAEGDQGIGLGVVAASDHVKGLPAYIAGCRFHGRPPTYSVPFPPLHRSTCGGD